VALVVNDNYTNTDTACVYLPITNASVTLTLPTWLQSPTAFEICASGIRDVTTQTAGNQLQVNLGTVELTRMIVITKDAQLRETLQQRYDQQFRPAVCALAPELCVGAPPTLGYIRQGNALEFSWPTNSVGFALEYATRLPPTNWVSASPAPVIVGGRYFVTNTMTEEGYYRLRKQ